MDSFEHHVMTVQGVPKNMNNVFLVAFITKLAKQPFYNNSVASIHPSLCLPVVGSSSYIFFSNRADIDEKTHPFNALNDQT